jgi:hypothetical protein
MRNRQFTMNDISVIQVYWFSQDEFTIRREKGMTCYKELTNFIILSTVTANKMKHKNIPKNQKYKKYFLNDFAIFRNGM